MEKEFVSCKVTSNKTGLDVFI